MNTIAIFSDVHGNLPALTTVLNDFENRKVDQVFCLGDLTDFAPWTNEVIDLIRSKHISCLMGNHDERIAFDYAIESLQKDSPEEKLARVAAINYTREGITTDNKNYLAALNRQIKLSFSWPHKSINILLVHGSPRSNDEYIYEHHDAADLEKMMDQQSCDILIMGHTHQSYIRKVTATANGTVRMALNAGSAGRSKEGRPLATYLLLRIDEKETRAEIIKLHYPVKETIAAISNSGIPDFYIELLQQKS